MGGGGGAGGGSNVFNVGRSKAQLFEKGTNRITFKDVAGQAAAKQEVQVSALPHKCFSLYLQWPVDAVLISLQPQRKYSRDCSFCHRCMECL